MNANDKNDKNLNADDKNDKNLNANDKSDKNLDADDDILEPNRPLSRLPPAHRSLPTSDL